jgi:hypothetical protein
MRYWFAGWTTKEWIPTAISALVALGTFLGWLYRRRERIELSVTTEHTPVILPTGSEFRDIAPLFLTVRVVNIGYAPVMLTRCVVRVSHGIGVREMVPVENSRVERYQSHVFRVLIQPGFSAILSISIYGRSDRHWDYTVSELLEINRRCIDVGMATIDPAVVKSGWRGRSRAKAFIRRERRRLRRDDPNPDREI